MKPADRQRHPFDAVSRELLRSMPAYRGPDRTLILFDPWLEAWLITGWDGGEVLVPEADLEAFLAHCARHLRGCRAPHSSQDTRSLVSSGDDETQIETPEAEPHPDAEPASDT